MRELQNVIEHMAVIADGDRCITPDDIPIDDAPMAQADGGLPAAIMSGVHSAKDSLIAHFERPPDALARAGGNMSKARAGRNRSPRCTGCGKTRVQT